MKILHFKLLEVTLKVINLLYTSFGAKLILFPVNLVTLKTYKDPPETLAEGSIDFLEDLEKSVNRCKNDPENNLKCLKLKVINYECLKMSIRYEVKFQDPPCVDSVLSIQLENVYNMNISRSDNVEACFRFPYNQFFRAALMQQIEINSFEMPILMNKMLKENNFAVDEEYSCLNLFYKNFQTPQGASLLHDLITNNRELLIELRINSKMYMTFLDLTVFNHPGVSEICYLVPLYDWNNKLILEQFKQEACLNFETAYDPKRRRSRKSIRDLSACTLDVLTPVYIEDKPVALKVILKLSKPLHEEPKLDSLYNELNDIFPYVIKIDEEECAVDQSKRDFQCIVKRMAGVIEDFMKKNLHLTDNELKEAVKKFIESETFCFKSEFKDSLRSLIGNTFNKDQPTFTTHDFKLLMMKVFKTLSYEMEDILIKSQAKRVTQKYKSIGEEVRKWQLEEYIANGEYEKAETLREREFKNNLNEEYLKEEVLYLVKLRNFQKLEEVLRKLMRIHKYCSFTLYFLFYLLVIRKDYKSSILVLSILSRLKPGSMEYWILLSELYRHTENIPGMLYCEIKIQGTRFILNHKHSNLVSHSEIILVDPLASIQWHQFSSTMYELMEMTNVYAGNGYITISDEELILKTVQLTQKNKFDEALVQLKDIIMTDENEATLRLLKGNILYETQATKWKAVCEYEIAFLKTTSRGETIFPLITALRCGTWFLNQVGNYAKAKKYFQYCCRNFGTYDSLIGLGKVYLKLEDYKTAESCFIKVNSIDPESIESWILLALTESKLDNFELTLNCYLQVKSMGCSDSQELMEIEEYLEI